MTENKAEKFGHFSCKRCGECCSKEYILFDGVTDEEWIPIIEHIKKFYNGTITIRDNYEPDEEWTVTVESIDDINNAKKDINSDLYWALDMGHCPFVKKDSKGAYYCEIYDIRPEVCKFYRCDLSGEEWKEYIGYKTPK